MTLVFARKPSPDLARLVKVIEADVARNKEERGAFVVFLPDDAQSAKPQIEAFAAQHKISLPLTVAENLDDIRSKFKIEPSDTMPVQVLVYRQKSVQKPFTLTQIKDADIKAVQAAMRQNMAQA